MIATPELVLGLAALTIPEHLLAIEPSQDPDFAFVLRIKLHALPDGEPYSAALWVTGKDRDRSELIADVRGLAGAYADTLREHEV